MTSPSQNGGGAGTKDDTPKEYRTERKDASAVGYATKWLPTLPKKAS